MSVRTGQILAVVGAVALLSVLMGAVGEILARSAYVNGYLAGIDDAQNKTAAPVEEAAVVVGETKAAD